MSYDLAFWKGPRPADDAEAVETFEKMMDAAEEADDVPPTPAIDALVRELESRWPVDAPDAPWATFPLGEDAIGDTLYVNLTLQTSDRNIELMVATARRLGPVCYDPQREMLL